MRHIFETARERDERGSALVLVAFALVLLMGLAAFGVDLAWFYLNSSRIQRAADAAALAGVIHLPADEGGAITNANAVAIQNGYDDAADETSVAPLKIAATQLQVTISQEVPTFFLKVFGIDSQTITERAVAEYIPPLKLGSPSNRFGNDPSCYSPGNDCAGNFWANIHGTRTDTGFGDAFSSYCTLGVNSDSCAQNPMYRNTGYLYGVIPHGSSFTLETLDLAYHNDTGGVNNGDPHRTGDHDAQLAGANPGQSVTINVYAPDPTPLNIMNNTRVCNDDTYIPLPQVNPDSDPPFSNWLAAWQNIGKGWRTACGGSINTSSAPEGIWIVQIVANAGTGRTTQDSVASMTNMAHSGLNRYSIRTSSGSNIFALGDFSIYNNASGTATRFYLAEVPDYYAGDTFVVEMYDTGESSDTGTLQPVDPRTGNPFNSGQCRIYSKTIAETSWGAPDTTINAGSTCQESVSPSEYHGRWLKFEMDLPPNYECDQDAGECWWQMNYNYPSTVNDTTTWRAYMIGNPIHLID